MNRTPVYLLIAFVVIAAAAVAWLFGLIAGAAYAMGLEDHTRQTLGVGQWWGAITGLIAGAIWCGIMVPKVMRSPRRGWAGAGALTGLAVGWLSTLLLHAVLIRVTQGPQLIVVLIGLACGTVTGLLLGAVCGVLCGVAAQRARPNPESGAGMTLP